MSKTTVAKITGIVTWSDGTEHQYTVFPNSGDWTWQQGGLPTEELGEREFGDVLTTLAEAVAVHTAERTPTTHYHVGSNIEGYLPESDVACFDDPEDAREYLDREMSNTQDSLHDCENPADNGDACGDCDSCKAHAQIEDNRTELRRADVTQGGRWTYNDGHALDIAQWIAVVPAEDCEIEDD